MRNKEKMKADHDLQLQAKPKRSPVKPTDLSLVVVTTHLSYEQVRSRDKLCNVLAELNIDLISVSESIRHLRVSLLA